ncbi:MAG: ABC transporter substrate-binding protein [Candidatus Tectomicrobia bacterium]|nr:ABC transporter substrate-binding protein [Candidatus Tectomicrobia bacterium]
MGTCRSVGGVTGRLAVVAVMGALLLARAAQPAAAAEKVVFATTGSVVGVVTSIAKSKQFDAKNGIDLDLKSFPPDRAMQALVQKNVDAGILGVVAAVRANARNNPIRIIAPLMTSHWSVVVPADSPAKSFADLKGQRVGSLSQVTGIYNIAKLILKMRGIDIDNDFKLVFGAPQVLQGLLLKKELAGVIQSDQNTIRKIADGEFRELANLGEIWTDLTGAEFLTSVAVGVDEGWVKENPQRSQRLVRTIAESLGFVRAHPAETFAAAKEILGIKTEAQMQLMVKMLPRMYPSAWNPKLLESTKLFLRKNIEFGLLPAEAAQHIDTVFSHMPKEIAF